MEATASLEHLASILDPAEELDTNERLQLASRALARFERYIQPFQMDAVSGQEALQQTGMASST